MSGIASAVAAPKRPAIDERGAWPPGVILRDIARSGVAGIIVGLVVAGLGGRIVMRLAALRVPEATGSFTENGNVIGQITLAGSLTLVMIGLLFGMFAGTMLVVVRPWLPATGIARRLAVAIAALGLGAFGLIQRGNPDFVVLRHDPLIVALLVGLVGLVGLSISLVDDWLEGRLPIARSAGSVSAVAYILVTAIGLVLIFPLTVASTFGSGFWPVGVGLVVVGCATLRWWAVRLGGASEPPPALRVVARVSLVATAFIGAAIELPEIVGALGSR